MSRQDADDEPETTSEDGGSGSDAGEGVDGTGETVEEIAAEPDGDVDDALAGILADDSDAEAGGEETEPDDTLVESVERRSPTELARALERLGAERAELEAELESERERAEDLESRLKRKQADFQNYKKRQKERLEEQKQRATEDLVERLLEVRDNLARALDQDESVDIRDGVETTLEQFDDELDRENVSVIEPTPGSTVDPQRHEVLIRMESDQPTDSVAELHRPGYEMAGRVLRPAQVAVSDGPAEQTETTETEDETGAPDDDTEVGDESEKRTRESNGGT